MAAEKVKMINNSVGEKPPENGYEGAGRLQILAERLPSWFEENKRDLPWRGTGDPYDVWISEIMLQQTRVSAVIEYFRRFRAELPGIRELASCGDERLMKLWQGLGYYSRARNLKRAAALVLEEYGGQMPSEAEKLKRLPGIGSYTAGAIASIAFGEAVPAVDGNVLRVCARVSGNDSDIGLPQTKRDLEKALETLMKEELQQYDSCGETAESRRVDPGVFNQALMELGALVCVPNGAPACGICPVREGCCARAEGMTDRLPVKSAKKARRAEKKTVFLIRSGDRYLIRKRPGKGLLAGLWEFPSAEGFLNEEEALAEAGSLCVCAVKDLPDGSAAWPGEPLFIRKLQDVKHVFTHVEWHMQGFEIHIGDSAYNAAAAEDPEIRAKAGEMRFVTRGDMEKYYSLPSAFAAYVRELY